MESLRKMRLARGLVLCAAGVWATACSPEAQRVRDGGPGADPQNSRLVQVRAPNPKAADTTLWPGRAPTQVERHESGTMYPPRAPVSTGAAPAAKAPSRPEQRAFDQSATDPRPPESR
jgi:hypothetical protein